MMSEQEGMSWEELAGEVARDMGHLLAACRAMLTALEKKSSADIAIARAKMQHWVHDIEARYPLPK